MSVSDAEIAAQFITRVDAIHTYLQTGTLSDRVVAHAVCFRLAIAIDVLSKATVTFRDQVTGDDWDVIWATRNRIVHGYLTVDSSTIAATLVRDLPILEQKVRAHLR